MGVLCDHLVCRRQYDRSKALSTSIIIVQTMRKSNRRVSGFVKGTRPPPFFRPLRVFTVTRMTTRASIDSVIWRYQPCQGRTSYSSSPVSCFAACNAQASAGQRMESHLPNAQPSANCFTGPYGRVTHEHNTRHATMCRYDESTCRHHSIKRQSHLSNSLPYCKIHWDSSNASSCPLISGGY